MPSQDKGYSKKEGWASASVRHLVNGCDNIRAEAAPCATPQGGGGGGGATTLATTKGKEGISRISAVNWRD